MQHRAWRSVLSLGSLREQKTTPAAAMAAAAVTATAAMRPRMATILA
jgi:hypothetical protein